MAIRNSVSESAAPRLGRPNIGKKQVKLGPDEASRDQILSTLKSVAPVPQPLLDMLDIPEKLFVDKEWTFSSKPNSTIHRITYTLHNGLPLPDEIPDYAISLSNHGSSLFITFVDKKKKVIVHESVGHEQSAGTASYADFQSSLSKAIQAAKSPEGSAFIVVRDGIFIS